MQSGSGLRQGVAEQASSFSGIVNQVKSLICCGLTNTLWNLWLASVILGAIAGLLGRIPLPLHCLASSPSFPHSRFILLGRHYLQLTG